MTTKPFLRGLLVGAALLGGAALLALPTAAADGAAQSFASPEAAAQAVASACEKNDVAALVAIFGPGSEDIVSTGDDASDAVQRKKFAALVRQSLATEPSADGSTTILVVGFTKWPFPVPLVQDGGAWRFDLPAAREEILARRIGKNELATIDVLRQIGPAQANYASQDHDGDGCHEFAQKILSTPGQHDGLYWEAKEGEALSPVGPLVAAAGEAAAAAGVVREKSDPWEGYYYRILKKQGPNAPGGAFDYVTAKGDMIGGAAMIAWPAERGNTGIMTFLVGREGVVYQKDLGEKTDELAKAIDAFDPDASWARVGDGPDATAQDPACAVPGTAK